MKYLIMLTLFVSAAFASDTLINQIKLTSSVYSGAVQVDGSNPSTTQFELMLTNQKIFLALDVAKLNTSALTLINSDPGSKRLVVPTIEVHNFTAILDGDVVATTCNGSDVLGTDTDCTGRACTVSQRIISACNASDCWDTTATTDRLLTSEISESFSLATKVDISDCLSDRQAGSKHKLVFSSDDTSISVLNGGQVSYNLILQNDVTE